MDQFKPKGLEDILAESFKETDLFAEESPLQAPQAQVQTPVQDQSYTNLENLTDTGVNTQTYQPGATVKSMINQSTMASPTGSGYQPPTQGVVPKGPSIVPGQTPIAKPGQLKPGASPFTGVQDFQGQFGPQGSGGKKGGATQGYTEAMTGNK